MQKTNKSWKLAQDNQGLIKKYLNCNRWIIDKSHTLEWEDYWQIGLIILHDAARVYSKKRGIFSSFAMKRLNWNMKRAYMNQAFPVFRVPVNNHPRKSLELEQMTVKEVFTYNALNNRVDLSCTNYLKLSEPEREYEESMFVFFK